LLVVLGVDEFWTCEQGDQQGEANDVFHEIQGIVLVID
jgi:hypothetical protein